MKVALAFITDDDYAMSTGVAIASALANKNGNSFYKIYVLTNNVSDINVKLFNEFKGEDFEINVLKADEILDFGLSKNSHVSTSALLKFQLPQILEEDKVLYLDGDVIVQKDLTELYNVDLKDNYAAVVEDFVVMGKKQNYKQLGYKYDAYFNSGVMLLNLKKMRDENITEKLLLHKKNEFTYYMDQDSFNCVLNPNVEYVSDKYNYLMLLKKNYSRDAHILHCAGDEKPWLFDVGVATTLFNKYLKKSPFKNSDLNLEKSKQNKRFKHLLNLFTGRYWLD